MKMKAINKTTLFLILTFTISYSLAGIYYLIGDPSINKLGFTLMAAGYMFIPAITAIIVKKAIFHEKIKKDLLISFKLNRWFLVAWLSMPVIVLCSVGISLLFPDVTYDPEMSGMLSRLEGIMTPEEMEEAKASLENLPVSPLLLILAAGLFAGITINAVAGFGEELGWRGFLLREFSEMSFVKASLLIGIIWGIWHAPLILMGHNYPQHSQLGVLMMVVLCILLTPLLLYITIKARSVIAAAVMHGTMNAVAGLSIMLIDGGNDLTAGIAGLAGFITIMIFLALLFVYDSFISKDKILKSRISKFI